MIQKLQRKFIFISMLAMIIVTGSIFGIIIFNNYSTIDKQYDGILKIISDNDGKFPEYKPRNDYMSNVITKETKFSTRYFYIKLDENNNISETNMQNIASISEEDVDEVLENILNLKKEAGYFENYKYKITEKDYGKIIVFLDCSSRT